MSHLVYRPLPSWTDPVTPHRQNHQFKAGWSDTLDILGREVEMLSDYDDPDVVLQVQVGERDVRMDGQLRAGVTIGPPGVVVSFESRHGPLRYACDTFESQWSGQMPSWQANVRAIALGLEALRKVSRYGIAGRGEQYTGWAQLGTGIPNYQATALTRDQAVELLLRWRQTPDEFTAADVLADLEVATLLYKRGAKRLHPDTGTQSSDTEEFKLLAAARDYLVVVHS